MYGVVLWSDSQENKAVIWCEDHGDLAFYRKSGSDGPVALDAGDWVQFDLTTESKLRVAHNPRLVCEGVCEGLADALDSSPAKGAEPCCSVSPASNRIRASAEIIPFTGARQPRGVRLSRTSARLA